MEDPSLVPEYWVCSMNQDETANDCGKGEGEHVESDEDLVGVEYTCGSLVWIKFKGTNDPNLSWRLMSTSRIPLVARHGGLLPRRWGNICPESGHQRGCQVPCRVSVLEGGFPEFHSCVSGFLTSQTRLRDPGWRRTQ